MSVSSPAASETPAAPAAKKKGRKLILAIVCLVCIGGGVAVPMVVKIPPLFAGTHSDANKSHADAKTVAIPFGDIVVNLSEERMTRYLRLKMSVVVAADQEKELTEQLTKQKVAIKSKLISHIAGKTLKDVSGTVGVNRLQRETLERFEEVLFPEGPSRIKAVLFEEYVVQ